MASRLGSIGGGRRLRIGKRVAGTAAVFTALAALTGSQVTGIGMAPIAAADQATPSGATAPDGGRLFPTPGGTTPLTPADGGGTLQLPQPPGAPGAVPGLPGQPVAGPFAATGPALPATVFAAYRQAEARIAQRSPGCHLPWQLLAAIGQVESGQANGGQVDAAGTTLTPILGPVLDGSQGFAAIPDTDGGVYDGDQRWDRAVGPMQFIPSTWASWGVDANGKGKADPNNIFDAAEAAGRYLCAGGRDLADPAQLDRAVLSYNNSTEYLRTVRNWMVHFGSGGVATVPDRTGTPAPLPSPYVPPTGSTGGTGTAPVTPGPGTSTTPTPDGSASPSASPSPSPSASSSASPSTSPSATPSGGTSPSATPSGSPSGTPSSSPSGSPSGTPTACPDPSATATPSGSPTGTPSPSTTPSATPSGTPSATPTVPADCPTPTATTTPGATTPGGAPGTPAAAVSAAATASLSPTAAPSTK